MDFISKIHIYSFRMSQLKRKSKFPSLSSNCSQSTKLFIVGIWLHLNVIAYRWMLINSLLRFDWILMPYSREKCYKCRISCINTIESQFISTSMCLCIACTTWLEWVLCVVCCVALVCAVIMKHRWKRRNSHSQKLLW